MSQHQPVAISVYVKQKYVFSLYPVSIKDDATASPRMQMSLYFSSF